MRRIWRPNIPLPSDWPEHARTGIIHAIALAHFGLTHIRGWCENSRIQRVKLKGQAERAQAEVALLREEMRIKDARMARLPAANRPHYPPTERLAILELKAARGWNQAQTARAFLLTEGTIASWLQRLDEDGPDALVKTVVPVNKVPALVTYLVQRLKATLPAMGKVQLANVLARAGLHLSATSVKRILQRPASGRPPQGHAPTTTHAPAAPGSAASSEPPATGPANQNAAAKATEPPATRRVIANYPNHVWSLDQSAVPICGGLWAPWLAQALPQCWPFCFWLSVIVDHFSRRVMGIAVFPHKPSAQQVCDLLERAVQQAGAAPKYTVSDQGSQFQGEYRNWCERHGVKPRFGALYRHGSIALTERLVLSIKNEGTRKILVPFGLEAMRAELDLYGRWYNQWRPHQSLAGRTPDEVYTSRASAREGPRFEPRARYPTSHELRGEAGELLQ